MCFTNEILFLKVCNDADLTTAFGAGLRKKGSDTFSRMYPIPFFLAAGLVAVAATAHAAPVTVHQREGHEHYRQEHYRHEVVGHGYSNPAKPMKASDRLPAMIRVRPVPLAMAGMSDSSEVSRIEAISTSASVRPRPAPIANTMPCTKS